MNQTTSVKKAKRLLENVGYSVSLTPETKKPDYYKRYYRSDFHAITLVVRKEGNTLKVGWSRCSTNDQFDRKLGTLIAEGRLNSKSALTIESTSEKFNWNEVVDELSSKYIHDEDYRVSNFASALADFVVVGK